MKALVKASAEPGLWMQDVPEPTIGMSRAGAFAEYVSVPMTNLWHHDPGVDLEVASIIDGIRLCKAVRFRYKNRNMADLEAKLIEADQKGARFKLIATDGVFSMDG